MNKITLPIIKQDKRMKIVQFCNYLIIKYTKICIMKFLDVFKELTKSSQFLKFDFQGDFICPEISCVCPNYKIHELLIFVNQS